MSNFFTLSRVYVFMQPWTIVCCLSSIQIEVNILCFHLLHFSTQLESSGQRVPGPEYSECSVDTEKSFDVNQKNECICRDGIPMVNQRPKFYIYIYIYDSSIHLLTGASQVFNIQTTTLAWTLRFLLYAFPGYTVWINCCRELLHSFNWWIETCPIPSEPSFSSIPTN